MAQEKLELEVKTTESTGRKDKNLATGKKFVPTSNPKFSKKKKKKKTLLVGRGVTLRKNFLRILQKLIVYVAGFSLRSSSTLIMSDALDSSPTFLVECQFENLIFKI
uniref:Uncharacterized protein n=1 Tax=Cacopsylla melanoneura TaxID=428564 RepID=A0A8D8ZEZ2_9HEMI